MRVRLYVDVHVPRAVTEGLRLRGIDVLTAQEDGAAMLQDPELLTRAAERGRLLFTQDEDLLAEAARRQRAGETFGGLVYAHQLNVFIGVPSRTWSSSPELRISKSGRIRWPICRSDES